MSAPHIVVTDYDYGDTEVERRIVEGAGLRFTALRTTTEAEIVVAVPDATCLITQYSRVGRTCFDGLPGLVHVARYGVGTDIVDVALALERGIAVTNVPADYCMNEVADHALALLLHFARGLDRYDPATRAGEWRWQSAAPLHRLADSFVGIIGMGRIGQAVARRCQAFGCTVVASDPYAQVAGVQVPGVTWVDLSELLETSAYVIIQAPLTEQTRGMIDAAAIARMREGAVLINTSRGPMVDTHAVRDAIIAGKLRGAAFDDLPEEPAKQRHWRPADPLFTTPNTLITPHAAYYSEESIAFCREWAATEAVRLATGLEARSPVPGSRTTLAPAGAAPSCPTRPAGTLPPVGPTASEIPR